MYKVPKTLFYSQAVLWKSIKKPNWEEGKKIQPRSENTPSVISALNRALKQRLTKSTNKLLLEQHSVGETINGFIQ